MENYALVPDFPDAARFRRRHLADKRVINRIVAKSNTFYPKDSAHTARTHIAGIFSKGSFHFPCPGGNFSLKNNFSCRGDKKRNCFARDQVNRLASKSAG